MSKTSKYAIIPVMLCFFCMGFVDLVGIASNYVKEDLGLNDSTANVFPRAALACGDRRIVTAATLRRELRHYAGGFLLVGNWQRIDANVT